MTTPATLPESLQRLKDEARAAIMARVAERATQEDDRRRREGIALATAWTDLTRSIRESLALDLIPYVDFEMPAAFGASTGWWAVKVQLHGHWPLVAYFARVPGGPWTWASWPGKPAADPLAKAGAPAWWRVDMEQVSHYCATLGAALHLADRGTGPLPAR